MNISPARRAAFEILRRVGAEESYSSVLLATTLDDLSPRDRGLCHELVLGTLRRQLWLDRSLEHFAARPVRGLDLPVLLALRLGLYQLRFLTRIPASAAVNESVNLVRSARLKSAASFVNAVLRRATREPDFDPAAESRDQIDRIAVSTSHPSWLLERWIAQFGETEAAALADANNQPAVSAFRLTAKAAGRGYSQSELLDGLQSAGSIVSSEIARYAWRCLGKEDGAADSGGLSMTSALRKLQEEGLIYFQDEASQLVAQLAATGPPKRVLDVCAAPGSKSTLIAALAPRAQIISGDLYEHRVRTMRELAQLQQASMNSIVYDATTPLPFRAGSFDRVLVDAPCSGTGTLRHNPEIRWRLQTQDIDQLAAKQMRILKEAAVTVQSGGVLLYSTCSVEVDENESVARAFLDSHPNFEPQKFDVSPNLMTADRTFVRTWPHHQQTDGFFAAAFRRKS